MRTKASGFYADSLEMLLDTMCNVLGGIIFITLTLAVLTRNSSTPQSYQKQGAQLTNELAAVMSSNAIVQAEIQQAVQQLLDRRQGAETNQMRLPNLSQTTRKPWNVIVRYGRIYTVYSLPSDARSELARNTRTIDWQGAKVEPKPGQGDDAESGVEAMDLAFKRTSQTNFYIAFYVYQDSFSTFNRAKEEVANLGLQYGWEPVTPGVQLSLTGRGSGISPQN